jgi:two-component system NtrC family sensor kinase
MLQHHLRRASLPSRVSRSLPKKTSVPAAIEVLSQLASCIASSTPYEALPVALQSLAAALGAQHCAIERIVDGTLVTVSDSRAASGSTRALKDERFPIEARGRAVGSLIAYSASPLGNASTKLLAAAANVLAPAMIVAELIDRTALDEAEHTRGKALESRFTQQVLDSLPLGLHVVDRDYRIRAWNRKRETGLQGVPRDAALGRSIFDVLRKQPESMLREQFDSVFQSGEILRFDIESGTSDSPRIFRVSKIPMRDGNAVVTHVITIGEDVTDAVRAQEEVAQARKLAAIGTLAAGAMHEINNPLATIGACAETLAMQLADPALPESLREPFAELCDIIDHEVHRSKRILNGLLDFSRPTGVTRSPGDLGDIIEQTLRLLKYHPTFKAMQVDVDVEVGERLVVRADRDQLVQVLMALMLNAMDAMEQAGTIRLKAYRSPVRGEELIMEVIDQGSGISSTVRQRLFEPFFTTKPPGRGTGLGLSICYGIVADHGGRIEVDSALRQGSTFRVILPLAESAT